MGTKDIRMGLVGICLCAFAVLLGLPATVLAEPERVLVIVESDGADATAAMVRARLARQTGSRILSLRQVEAQDVRPDVVVTASRESSDVVNVLYWDITGRVELLSAPVADEPAAFETVIATLASALLQRHLPRLARHRVNPNPYRADAAWNDGLVEWRVYAALGQLGSYRHRTYPLRIEEF